MLEYHQHHRTAPQDIYGKNAPLTDAM